MKTYSIYSCSGHSISVSWLLAQMRNGLTENARTLVSGNKKAGVIPAFLIVRKTYPILIGAQMGTSIKN